MKLLKKQETHEFGYTKFGKDSCVENEELIIIFILNKFKTN